MKIPCFAVLACLAAFSPGASPLSAQARTEAVPAYRQHGAWRSSSLGGGGYIQGVAGSAADPARLYTHVDVGGVYRSDDYGRTWRMVHGGWPAELGIYDTAAINVDPRDADVILAATGSTWYEPCGVMRSKDGGATWKKVLAAPFYGNGDFRNTGQVLARHPTEPDRVYAASGGAGVYRSKDGGATWRYAGLEGYFITHLQVDAARPGRLLACARASKPFNAAEALAGGYFVSENDGVTWKKIADEADTPWEMAQAPWDARLMLGLFGNSELRLSRDAGLTWEPFGEGTPFRHIEKRAYDNEQSNSYAITAGPGFWLAASRQGVIYRVDAGETVWKKVKPTSIVEKTEGRRWWGDMASTEGKEWTHFGSALGFLWVDPANADRWVFTDWFALYQSTDAGATWELSLDGIESTCIHTLTQDPHTPTTVHAGFWDIGYVRSEDQGLTFDRDLAGVVNSNMKSISPSLVDARRIYATGDFYQGKSGWFSNQPYRSVDGGKTWEWLPFEGLPLPETGARFNSIEADPRDADTAYLAVSGTAQEKGGLYRTTDGGQSWALFGEGLADDQGFFLSDVAHYGPDIAALEDGSLLAISFKTRRMARLGAGEKTWQHLPLPVEGEPRSIVGDPRRKDRVYLSVHNQGAYRSDDGGLTWREIFRGRAGRLVLDRAIPDRLAVGTEFGIHFSRDAGATWIDVTDQLPTLWYPNPGFAGERLLIGTIGTGVFWRDLPAAPLSLP